MENNPVSRLKQDESTLTNNEQQETHGEHQREDLGPSMVLPPLGGHSQRGADVGQVEEVAHHVTLGPVVRAGVLDAKDDVQDAEEEPRAADAEHAHVSEAGEDDAAEEEADGRADEHREVQEGDAERAGLEAREVGHVRVGGHQEGDEAAAQTPGDAGQDHEFRREPPQQGVRLGWAVCVNGKIKYFLILLLLLLLM